MCDASFRRASMPQRVWQLLLGWGSVGLAYGLASIVMGTPAVIPMTALDRIIPFSVAAVWIYLSFFLLIPYAYLQVDGAYLHWLRQSMQCSAVICGGLFLLWPTTLIYPPIQGVGASVTLLRWLAATDSPQNCLPSLHGALTVLCVWSLYSRRRPLRSILTVAAGLSIGISIIAVRRHLSIDLGAGVAVGLGCGWLCRVTYRTPDQQSLELV